VWPELPGSRETQTPIILLEQQAEFGSRKMEGCVGSRFLTISQFLPSVHWRFHLRVQMSYMSVPAKRTLAATWLRETVFIKLWMPEKRGIMFGIKKVRLERW